MPPQLLPAGLPLNILLLIVERLPGFIGEQWHSLAALERVHSIFRTPVAGSGMRICEEVAMGLCRELGMDELECVEGMPMDEFFENDAVGEKDVLPRATCWKQLLADYDHIPSQCCLSHYQQRPMRRPAAMPRVVAGARLGHIFVGGHRDYITSGQNPPAQGDAWEYHFILRRGTYDLTIEGGTNPHHGILSLTLDDDMINETDWCPPAERAMANAYPVQMTCTVEVEHTGWHRLRGEVSSKSDISRGYWMCLTKLELVPQGEVWRESTGAHAVEEEEPRGNGYGWW